jgi:hypothetical protein
VELCGEERGESRRAEEMRIYEDEMRGERDQARDRCEIDTVASVFVRHAASYFSSIPLIFSGYYADCIIF